MAGASFERSCDAASDGAYPCVTANAATVSDSGSTRTSLRWGGFRRSSECRERITKTAEQIKEMVAFIKSGERSDSIGSNLRGLESYLRAEKATLAKLLDQAEKPAHLPSVDDVARLVYDLDMRLAQDIEAGRAQLVRWLRAGEMRVSQESDRTVRARGDLNLRAISTDAENSKAANHLAASKSGRYTGGVAGAPSDR